MSEGDNRSSPGNASLALPPVLWRRSMDAEAVPHPACKGKHRGARRDAARGRRSRSPGDCPRASPHRLRALDATDGGTPTRPAREVSVGVRPQPAAHARAWRLVGARPRQAHVRGISARALCLQAPLIITTLSTPDAAHAPGAQALAAPLAKSAARWTFHKRLCRVEAAGASGRALDSASAMTARARKRRGEQNGPARPRRNLIGKSDRYMIPGIVGGAGGRNRWVRSHAATVISALLPRLPLFSPRGFAGGSASGLPARRSLCRGRPAGRPSLRRALCGLRRRSLPSFGCRHVNPQLRL